MTGRCMPVQPRILRAIETNANGCWVWQRATQSRGYGSIGVNGRTQLAHRAAFVAWGGVIPDGFDLDHLCHTRDTSCPGGAACGHRLCVNPNHLEAVEPDENNRRGLSPWAINGRRTHCTNGHPFTEDNTRIRADGRRNCRTCQRASSNAYLCRTRAEAKVAA